MSLDWFTAFLGLYFFGLLFLMSILISERSLQTGSGSGHSFVRPANGAPDLKRVSPVGIIRELELPTIEHRNEDGADFHD